MVEDAMTDTLLDLDLPSVPDLVSVEQGDYTLQIRSAKKKQTKKDKPAILVVCNIEGMANALPVFVNLNLPHEDNEQWQNEGNLRAVKTFCIAFSIDINATLDLSTWVGMTATALISPTTFNGQPQNQVDRFV